MAEGLGEWDDELEDTAAAAEPAAEADADVPELFYPNVAEFVTKKLAATYRRQLNVQGGSPGARNGGNMPKRSAGWKHSGGRGNSCAWTGPRA
ncbi:hypothetical protein [Arthrobacter globiformis]|uniref:hypothetical protein n=1 Tax=Arthrobacter globiformis TaxID=1665 RepID=UPI002783135C|nr:hypothetical protein [Arthrobacter globiformis]MDQ0867375.1 hypothetical protein [Arthrobacter globiformis]